MNSETGTAATLIAAARDLFVSHGYAGTSIRAITNRAGTNLGAVTYHFGSKEALYDAVAATVAEPLRRNMQEVAAQPGNPLTRLDAIVRGAFEFLWEHPHVPAFMIQHLASSREPPPALREAIEANLTVISQLITEGQRDGSVRGGNARLMALSIMAQPIWLVLVRRLLRQTVAIDQERPETRSELMETAARFVRAGLAASPMERP